MRAIISPTATVRTLAHLLCFTWQSCQVTDRCLSAAPTDQFAHASGAVVSRLSLLTARSIAQRPSCKHAGNCGSHITESKAWTTASIRVSIHSIMLSDKSTSENASNSGGALSDRGSATDSNNAPLSLGSVFARFPTNAQATSRFRQCRL